MGDIVYNGKQWNISIHLVDLLGWDKDKDDDSCSTI